MSSWILSLKLALISAGVVSLAIAFKYCLHGIPSPYLYIIINAIIITIAASSRFQQPKSLQPPPYPSQYDSRTVLDEYLYTTAEVEVEVHQHTSAVQVQKPVTVIATSADVGVTGTKKEFAEAQDVTVLVVDSKWQEMTWEKPLVSSRFGHRKPNRTTPDQGAGAGVRALRVARPNRQDTLESTWKTITEGRHSHMPLARHLKKSEQQNLSTVTVDQVPKSKTLRMIQKEASVGRDELNRRVEAFINKFNDQMRIQRQESLNQYMEMIKRGV